MGTSRPFVFLGLSFDQVETAVFRSFGRSGFLRQRALYQLPIFPEPSVRAVALVIPAHTDWPKVEIRKLRHRGRFKFRLKLIQRFKECGLAKGRVFPRRVGCERQAFETHILVIASEKRVFGFVAPLRINSELAPFAPGVFCRSLNGNIESSFTQEPTLIGILITIAMVVTWPIDRARKPNHWRGTHQLIEIFVEFICLLSISKQPKEVLSSPTNIH